MKEQNKILPISKTAEIEMPDFHGLALALMRSNEEPLDKDTASVDPNVLQRLEVKFYVLGMKTLFLELFATGKLNGQSSLQPTIEELQKENDSLRKQLHDHNGMCQQKLSDQLKEVMPDIESKSKRIKELEDALAEAQADLKIATSQDPDLLKAEEKLKKLGF